MNIGCGWRWKRASVCSCAPSVGTSRPTGSAARGDRRAGGRGRRRRRGPGARRRRARRRGTNRRRGSMRNMSWASRPVSFGGAGIARGDAEQMAVEEPALALHEVVVVRRRDRHDVGEQALFHASRSRHRNRSQPAMNGHPEQSAPTRVRPSAASSFTSSTRSVIHVARFGTLAREVGRVARDLLFDHVGGDDRQLVGRPLLGAHERDAPVAPGRAAARRGAGVPRWSTRSSRRPSGSSSAMPGRSTRSTPSSSRCVLQPRSVGATRTIAERVEVARAPRRGRARAARARDRSDRRTLRRGAGPSSACASCASSKRRFETANRASADWLARRLPPACSRASRRRHMSSARRNIAGVTRGNLGFAVHAAHGIRRLRHAAAEAARDGGSPGAPRAGQYTRSRADRDRRRPRGLPLKPHLVGVLDRVGPRRSTISAPTAPSRSTTRRICAAVGRGGRERRRRRGHRARRQRPGRADLGQQGARRAGRALQRPLHRPPEPRQHNDANVLSIGARIVAPELAEEILGILLDTPFDGGRHAAPHRRDRRDRSMRSRPR